MSLGVTDEFMDAVIHDKMFDLKFEGKRYKTVRARYLWDEILRSTWIGQNQVCLLTLSTRRTI